MWNTGGHCQNGEIEKVLKWAPSLNIGNIDLHSSWNWRTLLNRRGSVRLNEQYRVASRWHIPKDEVDSCVEVIWRCQNQRTLDITTAQLTGDTFSVGELSISNCFKTNTRGWKLYYMVIFAPSSIILSCPASFNISSSSIYHHLQHIIILNITSCSWTHRRRLGWEDCSCIWIWECADWQWVSMMSVIIIFNMIADMTAMTVCDTTDMTVMTVLHDCHDLTWESVRAGGRRSRPRRPCRSCCCSCRRTRAPSRGTRPAHTQFAKLSSDRARNEPSAKFPQLQRKSHGWKCLLVFSHLTNFRHYEQLRHYAKWALTHVAIFSSCEIGS